MDILDVITDYFGVGGLFNPELMEHDKVSNMVEMARAEITSLRAELEKAKKDGERYNRLRVLGCAVFGSNQLENGTVIRFQSLDEVVDLDLDRHKSRGEAIDNAMKGKG